MSEIGQEIIELLIEKIGEEFELAGHTNTNSFNNSLRGEIIEGTDGDTINIYGNEYGIYLDKGVTSDKIPFSGSKGTGGNSKYITGLKNWVGSKLGISDDREALSIAFAIAHTHMNTGMPVRDGKLGSGFIDEVRKKYKDDLEALIIKYLNNMILKINRQ